MMKGGLGNLMRQAQQMQETMKKAQAELADLEVTGEAGAGMVKVNIGTALNIAFTGAIREHLAASSSVVDPRKYLAPARSAMAAVVADQLAVLAG